ncbi:MAG: DUF4870 domain-containing protein [Verrucomicrobiia bacterium]|jgi:uncharacterized Tic20 family protein
MNEEQQTGMTSNRLTSDEKLWSVLSHLSLLLGVGILLPLIVYLVKKGDSPAVAEHAKEALNFHISVYLYAIACMPLTLIFIGFLLLPVIAFASVILSIVAAVKSVDGVAYRYPLTLRFV